jgi:hypothetical protein
MANISNLKTSVEISESEITKEQQLFKKYKINQEQTEESEETSDKFVIFEKESPPLEVSKIIFSKENHQFIPTDKIKITF